MACIHHIVAYLAQAYSFHLFKNSMINHQMVIIVITVMTSTSRHRNPNPPRYPLPNKIPIPETHIFSLRISILQTPNQHDIAPAGAALRHSERNALDLRRVRRAEPIKKIELFPRHAGILTGVPADERAVTVTRAGASAVKTVFHLATAWRGGVQVARLFGSRVEEEGLGIRIEEKDEGSLAVPKVDCAGGENFEGFAAGFAVGVEEGGGRLLG